MSHEDLAERLLRFRMSAKRPPASSFLSTGSTLLNLALSGRARGGLAKGQYHLFAGDSVSGKTMLMLTVMAEAAGSAFFEDYHLIHDNVEDGALMDFSQFFGEKMADRVEPPAWSDDGPVFSGSVEEFYYHLDDWIKKEVPFIYLLDSMDALTSDSEQSKFAETKQAYRRGRQVAGSYGDGKAKTNSQYLRSSIVRMKQTGSMLNIIAQTRDNLGFGFEKKTRSGGRALKFYATAEVWSSNVKKLKKTVKGKPTEVGILCKFAVKKNRYTGRNHAVEIPIYHSYGIDDIGSCVDWLVDHGFWSSSGKQINPKGLFKKTATRDAIIRYIEQKGLERKLARLVEKSWHEWEKLPSMQRKPRYE